MTKLATALTLALVLAGCGSTPLFGAKVARSASARIMSSGTMTITAAKASADAKTTLLRAASILQLAH